MTAKGRASVILTVLVAACSCGGGLSFITPIRSSDAYAATSCRRYPGLSRVGVAARPAALSRLRMSKEPGGGGGIADALAAPERELSMEEKLAALQREIQAQAVVADEVEANKTVEEVAIIEKESMKDLDDDEVEALGFTTSEDFIDEGKKIIWPDTRRVIQLGILAVVAQVAFVMYILGLNYILNSIPGWFEKVVESLKAGGAS